jgi:hypothetical protein
VWLTTAGFASKKDTIFSQRRQRLYLRKVSKNLLLMQEIFHSLPAKIRTN